MNLGRRSARFQRAALALGGMAIASVGLLAAIGGAGAQDATPTAAGEPGTVSVTGQGVVKVTPDTASISIGVNVVKPTLAEAQTDATTQMTAIIDALQGAGIAQDDIQTSNFNVSILQNYDDRGAPGEITGFQISNQVDVTVRDINLLGELLDTVVGAGANTIYGISFFVDDPKPAASQARRLAVDDAKAKAEELADAAGLTVGRVLSISESIGQPPSPLLYRQAEAADAAGSAVPIATGLAQVNVDVQITYELIG